MKHHRSATDTHVSGGKANSQSIQLLFFTCSHETQLITVVRYSSSIEIRDLVTRLLAVVGISDENGELATNK